MSFYKLGNDYRIVEGTSFRMGFCSDYCREDFKYGTWISLDALGKLSEDKCPKCGLPVYLHRWQRCRPHRRQVVGRVEETQKEVSA